MRKFIYILFFSSAIFGCTDLNEELNDAATAPPGGPESLLDGAYGNLRNLQSQDNLFALATHSSDELAGPTRGRDWDDGGVWRVMHLHSWTPSHPYINNVWRTLGQNSFDATQVICNGGTGSVAAEAVFLKVFNSFLALDNFGAIPIRECGGNLLDAPEVILKRQDIGVLISELEGVLGDLPDGNDPGKATKNAARTLLAKMYLNKAVYEATTADGGAEEGPYNHTAADMNKVIGYVDALTGLSLEQNYFYNFFPENGETSTELIFVSQNTSGSAAGNVRAMWFQTLHYNQNPSGWNGFVALSDLYNRFEAGDERLQATLPYINENGSGINVGLLVGQQYDASGNPLEDRAGNPLVFTPEFDLLETGDDLEVAGIRAVKYPPDFDTPGDAADNDFVFFRYSDALLMKAEAILRGGTSSESALDIVNDLRAVRGASALGSLDLSELLDERSRELYWENWRRNDQIRFGTFLGVWQEKPSPSNASRLLFPIPTDALASNPNLIQNPGY